MDIIYKQAAPYSSAIRTRQHPAYVGASQNTVLYGRLIQFKPKNEFVKPNSLEQRKMKLLMAKQNVRKSQLNNTYY
jgi:hypothetical protein